MTITAKEVQDLFDRLQRCQEDQEQREEAAMEEIRALPEGLAVKEWRRRAKEICLRHGVICHVKSGRRWVRYEGENKK